MVSAFVPWLGIEGETSERGAGVGPAEGARGKGRGGVFGRGVQDMQFGAGSPEEVCARRWHWNRLEAKKKSRNQSPGGVEGGGTVSQDDTPTVYLRLAGESGWSLD